jgi:hypothetical protein
MINKRAGVGYGYGFVNVGECHQKIHLKRRHYRISHQNL